MVSVTAVWYGTASATVGSATIVAIVPMPMISANGSMRNDRMARLLMNHIQFEFGLVPSKVLREDREEYISSLITARDPEDTSVFYEFMVDEMVKTLSAEIDGYLISTGIKKQLAILKSQGLLRREGPDRGGRLVVIK